MQVSNTLNNVIRILFNPKVEAFKLFDFLVVKSNSDRYIAQIIEIYDDKFDASQNVAKLKLFYKITEANEVIPYDNFTPNKECEIIKIKQEEVEDFLNNDKETFVFGTNKKTSEPLNIQYDFFNENAIIIADKIESANMLSLALAKKLSAKKPSIIIDSTGIIEFEEAKKIKASKDFKMPLNYLTIDYIFDKCLKDASLEFQATCGEILNEIKKFAKQQPQEFIPFNTFTKVLLEQYKVTPYPELKLLISRLKKSQMDEIFAKSKKDYENLYKAISKNEVIIVDLSKLSIFWQKAYIEYIIEELQEEVYLITRINEENCDIDLINKIYCQKQNITFVPNVSYNYKKLPSVVQYCKNYILMQSLYQRTDFLNANFALANLITEDCIIFGKNTDDFLYLANNFELKIQEKKEEYRKIALSLLDDEDEEDDTNNFEENNMQRTDSQKLMEELNNFGNQNKEENAPAEPEKQAEEPNNIDEVKEKAEDYFEGIVEVKETEKPQETVSSEDNFEELADSGLQTSSYVISEEITDSDKEEDEENESETEKTIVNNEPLQEEKQENNSTEETSQELDLSDDELDFFQMAKESSELYEANEQQDKNKDDEKENLELDIIQDEPLVQENKQEDENILKSDDGDINLSELADNSIENHFDETINTSNHQNVDIIELDKDVAINTDAVENQEEKENLPIFKEELPENNEEESFKEGDVIRHKKYGVGKIIKTIQYEQRQFVQVEFETSGKILLDPRVADIKLEQ